MADLRDYTSLRVGGPAKKFVEVGTEPEIIAAIEAAGDSPILIIGGGTNILVADAGFEGTVIRIVNNSLQAEVDACSGATLTIGMKSTPFRYVTTSPLFTGVEWSSKVLCCLSCACQEGLLGPPLFTRGSPFHVVPT